MQAQQKLSVLGYDPGTVDGVLGPRTRQALQAFQQDHDLPSTGTLDAQTLEALGLMTPTTHFEHLPLQPPPAAPWRAVLTYLRYYDTQPARLLQVVTEHFRNGLTPQQWLKQTADTLTVQAFSRLSWQIERVEMEGHEATYATVYVQSRVRIAGEEITRQEIFSLLHGGESGEAEWLIDAWHSEPLPAEPAAARTKS
jgi:hypothetical protein